MNPEQEFLSKLPVGARDWIYRTARTVGCHSGKCSAAPTLVSLILVTRQMKRDLVRALASVENEEND